MLTDAVGPERYLRRLAEREMLESEPDRAFLSALERVAAAFLAGHVLERAAAASLVADCAKAATERRRPDLGFRWDRWVRTAPDVSPVALTPSRFVPGPFDVDVPWGHISVRWVRLAEDWTDMAVIGIDRTYRPTMRKGPPPLPRTLEMSDDRGTTTTCRFGGKSDQTGNFWGTFTARSPLAVDTGWLAFSGERVDLPAATPSRCDTRVEPVPVRPPGLSYLWHELALWGARICRPDGVWKPDGKTPVVEGLVAVGALDTTEPELLAFRWATEVLGGVRTGDDPPPLMPVPWAAMLAQVPFSPRSAVTQVVPAGVVAGPFDGVVMAIEGIDARVDGFTMEVAVSPRARLDQLADGTALEWWAEDDIGSVLLGGLKDWAGPAETAMAKLYGTIEFDRPIDARAGMLRIISRTMTEQAVITVPLPESREAAGSAGT